MSPLVSMKRLESLLRLGRPDLCDLAKRAGRFYHPFDMRKEKGKGKWRHIDKPTGKLKEVQRRITDEILDPVPLPENVFGGVRDRTALDHAARHVRQPMVVTLDLRDCFPRIHDRKVYEAFKTRLGCSTEIAGLLTKLTTFQHRLPQGAPSSTALANIVLAPMWEEIAAWTVERGLTVSFFVDDIALSGSGALEAIDPLIRIIRKHGHAVRAKKIRRMPAGGPQVVTGKTVNRKLSVPLPWRRRLGAEIIRLAHEEHPSDAAIQSVWGKIRYVASISQTQGAMFQRMAERLLPERGVASPKLRTGEVGPCRHTRVHRYERNRPVVAPVMKSRSGATSTPLPQSPSAVPQIR